MQKKKKVIFYRNFLAYALSLALAKVKFILIITDMKAATSLSVAVWVTWQERSIITIRCQTSIPAEGEYFERPVQVPMCYCAETNFSI